MPAGLIVILFQSMSGGQFMLAVISHSQRTIVKEKNKQKF